MDKIKELYAYRQMLISLVKKDLRGRYKASVLGFLWTFINPLLQLLVYTVVFSVVMRAGIEKFYIFVPNLALAIVMLQSSYDLYVHNKVGV